MADYSGINVGCTINSPGLFNANFLGENILISPAPTPALVTNRVWYVPGGFEVRWQTATPDTTGSSYPGPGVFGVDTTNYTVDDPGNVS